MTIRHAAQWVFVPFAIVVLACAGCGSSRSGTAIVRGKVTFNGKPVPNGTINFIPDTGPSASGEIQPDGSYTLTTYKPGDGAVLGTHKVTIIAMQDDATRLPEERSPLPPPIVPVKYTSLATTDLTATVEDKENQIDFDLKDSR